MIERSVEQAEDIIHAYIQATKDDRDDALADLLADLMHWADAQPNMVFAAQLERAQSYYDDEITLQEAKYSFKETTT